MAWVNMSLEDWMANLRRDAELAHRLMEKRFGKPCAHVASQGKCVTCLRTVRS